MLCELSLTRVGSQRPLCPLPVFLELIQVPIGTCLPSLLPSLWKARQEKEQQLHSTMGTSPNLLMWLIAADVQQAGEGEEESSSTLGAEFVVFHSHSQVQMNDDRSYGCTTVRSSRDLLGASRSSRCLERAPPSPLVIAH